MDRFVYAFSGWGYGLAAAIYFLLSFLFLIQFRRRLRGPYLFAATAATSAWAGYFVLAAIMPVRSSLTAFVLEILHYGTWLLFLSVALGGADVSRNQKLFHSGGVAMAALVLFIGLAQSVGSADSGEAGALGGTLILGSLFLALYALVLVEQIYRNARDSQRQGLKYLGLGVGGVFVFDLIVYSNATLTGQMNELLWGSRGFVAVMCAPFLLAAVKRSPAWGSGIFVSRHIVFHTATLFGAGIYLTIAGFAGVYVQTVGGDLGQALAILFITAAALFLGAILVSRRLRARLRVFISKHFYENKFDYREEWLRLIDTLTSTTNAMPLRKRAVQALAQIINAPRGRLWLRESGRFQCVAGWNIDCCDLALAEDHALVRFIQETGWLIDVHEYQTDPAIYQNRQLDIDAFGLEKNSYIVPLLNNNALFGFVVLEAGGDPQPLNYEDRDLLKTAGLQIASYLAQEQATEQLAEVKQFEAYNKLTAYLMHDLKNVVAQQALVVENAEKHKNNPAFVDDAVETVRGSVRRIRRIIEHLQQARAVQHQERVEIAKLIMQAVSHCADRKPEPRAVIGNESAWVRADPERLLMAISHAIRNAQDACDPSSGAVTVELAMRGDACEITISDNGVGMDDDFLRSRLFRPFDSTKGTQGMGIGAYQLRETVRAAGGDVSVSSAVDVGTTLTIRLNTVKNPDEAGSP